MPVVLRFTEHDRFLFCFLLLWLNTGPAGFEFRGGTSMRRRFPESGAPAPRSCDKSTRAATVLLAAALLACLFCACAATQRTSELRQETVYETYLDIPGVTEEEIAAIEALRESRSAFVYGMEPGTECFPRPDGSIGGFSVSLCDWLGELFGIPFTPVIYGWDDLLAGLASKEIDFSGDLTFTAERARSFWMTETPIAERSVKYMHLAGGKSPSDIAESRTLRYAFLTGTTTYEQARAFLAGEYEIRYVDNHSEAYRLLKDGEIDAFVDEGPFEAAFDAYGDVVAEDLLPIVYGPVSLSTQNPELAPVIDVVQKALTHGNAEHLATLYAHGYEEYLRNKFLTGLSPEETEYVRLHGEEGTGVKIAVEYDNYPAAFYNEREKAWQGCALDVLERISSLTGLRFTQVHEDALLWTDMLGMLESGEIALISELIMTEERTGRFIWPDSPYMTDTYALISRADTPDLTVNEALHVKVGLSRDTAYTDLFRQWFPGHKGAVEYTDILEALDALEKGEVDLVMGTQNQLLTLTNYMEKPYFKTNIPFDKTYGSYFGIDRRETVLCSILSKSLQMIDARSVSNRWKSRVFDYRGAIARARLPLLVGVSVLLAFVIVLLAMLFYKSRQAGKRLEEIVRERTAELERRIMRAESDSRAGGDFFAKREEAGAASAREADGPPLRFETPGPRAAQGLAGTGDLTSNDREHLFVINPISFPLWADMDRVIGEIRACFAASGERYGIHVSRFPRDAIRTIREYLRVTDAGTVVRVYAVGGDGILFDCLNGVVGFKNAELATVPYGNSNDFLRAFGEGKRELFRNIAAQAASPTVPTDIIFCGNNYALNTCTIGMEAYTLHKAAELNARYKNLWAGLPRGIGQFLYNFMFWLGGVISAMSPSITNRRYGVWMDGEEFSGNYATVNIANGPCYGGDKCAAIAAVPDDGRLDVMFLKSASRFQIVRVGTRYIYGKYRLFPNYVSYRRATEIAVRSDRPMVLQLDGELIFDTNIRIRIIPKAVNIVAVNGSSYERRATLDA
jgi:diacylglycerol kinase family enzyme/ABC-type amino acid transport substrate-binding protein